MNQLKTSYLGLQLDSPLVASSSPLSKKLENLEHMEKYGAGAVVLHSLFEEQLTLESLELDDRLSQGTYWYPESLTYLPDLTSYNMGPENYLKYIQKAKQALHIPVIASLNGTSTGAWVRYAEEIEQAGADALELNIYSIPTDLSLSGSAVECSYAELVRAIRAKIRIPLAVKLSPYFSAMGNFARELDEVGANGLVLFNRFYQPDINVEELEIVPNLTLSTPSEIRLRLRWVAILYGHLKADLAITGGVHSALEVLKGMMAGAKVTMMTSALLKYGIPHLKKVREDLAHWMDEHDYESIEQMQGSMSHRAAEKPERFERVQYIQILSSYKR